MIGRGSARLITQFLLTGATGAAAYWAFPHLPWPLVVLACYLHATVYSFLGLSGAGHELCHGTPFKTRFWNEVFLHIVSFLSWTNFIHFRASHNGHHKWTVHRGIDLEVVLPLKVRKIDLFFLFTFNWAYLWFTLKTTFRHSRGIIKGEWEERVFPASDPAKRRHLARWARVLLLGHLALAGLFVYFHLWPLLLLVTFAPFYAGWLNFL